MAKIMTSTTNGNHAEKAVMYIPVYDLNTNAKLMATHPSIPNRC